MIEIAKGMRELPKLGRRQLIAAPAGSSNRRAEKLAG